MPNEQAEVSAAPPNKYAVDLKRLEAQTQEMQARRGWFGRIFGMYDPGLYVGFTVFMACAIVLVLFTYFPPKFAENSFTVKDCWQYMTGVMGIAIGYGFGAKHSATRD